jgi:hypothetical protein
MDIRTDTKKHPQLCNKDHSLATAAWHVHYWCFENQT